MACRVNSTTLMKEALRAGFGIGIMGCFMGDPDPGLVRIGEPLPDFTRKLWILTHADLRRTARVRVVRDAIYEQLSARREFFEGA